MKMKLLFWSALLFFALGLTARESALYFFFSIHFFMLFIGVLPHKFTKRIRTNPSVESPPEATVPSEN